MAQYHINPETGNPNICRAHKGNCPFGGVSDHYASKDEARQAYESRMDEANEALQSVQKEIATKRLEKQAAAAEEAEREWWDARKDVIGLEVVDKATGRVETFIGMGQDEIAMPGYLEHVEAGYEGTNWETRRVTGAGEEDDPHCFVCNRHTDHFAEHDGLVEAGLAEYGKDGSVYRTDKWDDAKAKEVAEAEYQRYLNESTADAAVADAFGDQTPKPALSGGKPMNTYNAGLGDEYVDEEGYRYRVTGKNPAGAFGVAESAGPGVKLTRLKEDGSLSGYTRTVQHGGYYQPSQYTSVAKDLNGFTEGKTSYPTAIIATVQKAEFAKDPQGFLKTGKSNMVRLIVPDVQKLTDKRRLEIGRQAWEMSGRDVAQWDNSSEEQRISWTRTHMGRYDSVELEVEDGKVSWTTDSSSGANYPLEDVKLIKL